MIHDLFGGDEEKTSLTSLQPNSTSCFVCGVQNPYGLRLRFYNSGPGEVTAEYTVPAQYQGYPGVVHGGIIAAMLDEAAGRAYMGEDPPRFMYTAQLEIRYRKTAPVEQPLRLVGTALESRGRKATAKSALYDPVGNLLAEASAVLINVPDDLLVMADLESLGWRVYSEAEYQTLSRIAQEKETWENI